VAYGEQMNALIEFPADDPERARRFWSELFAVELAERLPGDGLGWQTEVAGVTLGIHQRGSGPGDRFSLPYFPVDNLGTALARVTELGGEVVHPGERWAVCRDSEGTPFALTLAEPTI
jgi:predicted enzyme related to lactoylglutathione lyase